MWTTCLSVEFGESGNLLGVLMKDTNCCDDGFIDISIVHSIYVFHYETHKITDLFKKIRGSDSIE